MKRKIILILLTDPLSISEEIILKSLNYLKKRKNYLFIGNSFFFKKLSKKLFVINNMEEFNKSKINFFDINYNFKTIPEYIESITDLAVKLLKNGTAMCLINMPLNKMNLPKNTPGYTEFFARKIDQLGRENMLLYSNDLAVCPITTHVPIRKVSRLISKKKILRTISNVNFFYKRILKKKIEIKICGLNPHGGKDIDKQYNEEKKLIKPLLKEIVKINKNVTGLYSADTVFLNFRNKVIIGMYHDQVIPPFKVIKNFKGINITIGLKYLRLTPDHGTGLDILKNKKKINNKSFKYCIKFCEKYLNV